MAYNYINSTGIISADTSDIKAEVEAEFISALKAPALSLVASSPQGVLIAAETLSRAAIAKNNAEMANLINPEYSFGTALDSVCALLGVSRGEDKGTVGVGVVFRGNAETTINSGSRIKTSNGDIFEVQSDVTIGDSLTATGNIVSESNGPIPLPSGDLTIVDGTIGWGGVTVAADTTVTLGTLSMTDAQLKTARNQRLFAQGIGSVGAIRAHLLAVDNVSSVNVIENTTGQIADEVNGVTFTLPAAVWVCVAGDASDSDIAAALWAARGGMPLDYGAAGQGTQVGATTGVKTIDPYSGVPYSVKWVEAVDKVVYLKITAKQGSSTATSTAIANAALSYANGELSGEQGLVVGAGVSAYEFSGAITAQYPGLFITKAQIAVTDVGAAAPSAADYTDYEPLSPWERGTLSTGNILVTIANG